LLLLQWCGPTIEGNRWKEEEEDEEEEKELQGDMAVIIIGESRSS
jgi:hypothetical protein